MDPVRCTKFFGSTFFDAILESHETTQHVVPSAVHAATAQYEDSRKSLELRYGVEIPLDAMQAACEILESISPKVGVVQLLEEAATKLRKDFDCDSEQKDLDFYEFLFNRAFVESREMMKEKDPALSDLLSCVNKELEEVKGALEAFTNRWPAPLHGQGQHHITVVRHKSLVHLAHLLRILYGAQEQGNLDGFTKAIRDLDGAFSALSETIDIRFAQHLTLTPRIVAEVASSITGVPRNFFPAPFQLPVELLMQRLSRKLVGLDNQLRAIINAMSIHKLGSRPLYSFLLLGPSGHGKTALAEALAKEMFDNRIVEYKVAGFTENDFIVQLFSCPFLVVDESEGASDSTVRLISSCVLVFDNIDKANTALYGIILQILESGSYVDACGRHIVFSNTLILFTSRVEFPRCCCARVVWETSFKPPFKGLLKSVGGVKPSRWCYCNFHECLADAEKQFKPRFFDSLDDVILIPRLSVSHFMSVFRIQVRNAAYSLFEEKVVVYPSAAAFCYVWRNKFGKMQEEAGHVLRHFVKELVSKLSNVDRDSVVYIDDLVGTNELSFRTKKLSDMTVAHDFNTLKAPLGNSRILYQFEKEQAKQIYKLSMGYFDLVKLLGSAHDARCSCIMRSIMKLLAMVDHLLDGPKDWKEQVPLEYFMDSHGVGDVVHERVKRARYMPEAMFSKMRSKLLDQVAPVQTVAKALFKCIDTDHNHLKDKHCQQVTSFLFIGLTSMGRRQLVDDLSKYFVADDGTTMLVEVDLSTCTSPNSFLRCTCRNEPGLLLKNAILMRPFSVIVVFNLQLAHQSAFTDIISILDDGLLSDNDGTVLDFRRTIIIFGSDLGNKRLIAELVGGDPNGSNNRDGNMDKDPIGFRFEILNRVDEILLFNELHSARLPMKEGKHLAPMIKDALVNLFYNGKGKVDGNNRNRFGELMEMTECSCLSQLNSGLVKKFDGTYK